MKEHRPRRGSMGFSPRKRASSIVPKFRSWPEYNGEPKLLDFSGYKAGMTHVVMIDDRKNSISYGEEVVVPVTVIEAPPIKVAAVRVYRKTPYGLAIAGEVWSNNLDEKVGKRVRIPKKSGDVDKLKEIEDISEVRVIVYTQPYRITGIPKKVPDLMEVKVGGEINSALEYAISKLGKEVNVAEVFKEGALVDVASITKGKGFQGVVKRWGVISLNEKHARSSKGRRIGCLGPWNPHHIRPTVPQSGQMGFHHRTEFNKRIIKIGENGEEITPAGGFVNYGVVRNDYILISGSVPGHIKRLVRIRDAIRPSKVTYDGVNLLYVSKSSKQGR